MTGRAGAAPNARVAMPGSDCSVRADRGFELPRQLLPVSTEVG